MPQVRPVSIRIVKTPAGEAPEEIRDQWVGLVLPAFPNETELGYPNPEFGLETGQEIAPRKSYIVPPGIAVVELYKAGSLSAAEYFAQYPISNIGFTFGADEVEVIENN